MLLHREGKGREEKDGEGFIQFTPLLFMFRPFCPGLLFSNIALSSKDRMYIRRCGVFLRPRAARKISVGLSAYLLIDAGAGRGWCHRFLAVYDFFLGDITHKYLFVKRAPFCRDIT